MKTVSVLGQVSWRTRKRTYIRSTLETGFNKYKLIYRGNVSSTIELLQPDKTGNLLIAEIINSQIIFKKGKKWEK